MPDLALRQADAAEIAMPHDPLLGTGELRDPMVRVEQRVHMTHSSTRTESRPPTQAGAASLINAEDGIRTRDTCFTRAVL